MNISGSLTCLKQVAHVEVCSSFIKNLCPKIFKDATIYESVTAGADFIGNISSQLFNFFNPSSRGTAKIWSVTLDKGIDTIVEEATDLIDLITPGSAEGQQLKIVLQSFITECLEVKKMVQALLKSYKEAGEPKADNVVPVAKKKK